MECPFPPMGKGIGIGHPRALLEGSISFDCGMRNSISEDMCYSFSELMNHDTYAGCWSDSPSLIDQILANEFSSFSSVPYISPDEFDLVDQSSAPFFMTGVGANYSALRSPSGPGEKVVIQQMDAQLGFSDDANYFNSKQQINDSSQQLNTSDTGNFTMCRPPAGSLDERMLRALSFFRESSGGGILAQVWVPIKLGDQFILSTSEQPYLLDQMLAGFREVSMTFKFSAEGKPGSYPGLPGRVFISKVPEWTSNVGYYNKTEYLRVEHAINHEVRGSIAVPIFDLHSEMPCCAVLELVTIKEKPDFDRELEIVCDALQVVNLRTIIPPRLLPQFLSNNKRAGLTEIMDVLRAVCHAHRLPLALTWIPCCYTEENRDETMRIKIKEGYFNSSEKCVLCIEESACYINDKVMEGFVHACVEHHLEAGQGIAGKALQSNHPFFYPDVKAYDISEYPLVHHARKYNLNAAVAVRLRSTYTNDDDYILEFFLPVNMRGGLEQQLLLDNLSGTMQRICRSLRTVSDAESSGIVGSPVRFQRKKVPGSVPMSRRNSKIASTDSDPDSVRKMPLKASNLRKNDYEAACNQEIGGSRRQVKKKRSKLEKNISFNVLQQHFSGRLKDAAKSIGVCPTTLKRICRQHGIPRWPSRKISKVNRSIKNIQNLLDSVQGVKGGFNFDPSKGGFVAGVSIIQEYDAHRSLLFRKKGMPVRDPRKDAVICRSSSSLIAGEMENGVDDGVVEHNHLTSSSMTDSSNDSSSVVSGSWSGSQSIENQKHSKVKSMGLVSVSKITVKATYREDTIRFKFDPSAGCLQLYEEVATRFKLQSGSFQLKYLDDEKEWVMLVDDSDLQESIETVDDIGRRSVKLLVRDMPYVSGD